ncbi:prepilin-type N-terminal cleavage/methylation domain-containing protein, partial [bacterium]|nr:prepilin-type N-terminal cleavage/methylation domain-containing protein [bacterium]
MFCKKEGFTFIELMITMVIFILTLLFAFKAIVSQKKTLTVEQKLTEMSQTARASLDILLREFRMAGYKTLEADFLNSLSDWISSEYLPTSPSSPNLSSAACPIITSGDGTEPDMITFFSADPQACALSINASSGDTIITLDPNSPGFTGNTKFRINDIIRIGDHTEFAKVIGIS